MELEAASNKANSLAIKVLNDVNPIVKELLERGRGDSQNIF